MGRPVRGEGSVLRTLVTARASQKRGAAAGTTLTIGLDPNEKGLIARRWPASLPVLTLFAFADPVATRWVCVRPRVVLDREEQLMDVRFHGGRDGSTDTG